MTTTKQTNIPTAVPHPALAARLYHTNGLAPIPWQLQNGRKAPTVKRWDDPDTRPGLPALLARWKAGDRIGLVTGRGGTTRNPIIVVDVDVKGNHSGDPAPFLTTTPGIVRTPSGGWHFFYHDDRPAYAALLPTRAGVLSGVDVRADRNGYVACWPSPGYTFGTDPAGFDRDAFAALLGGQLPGFSTIAALLPPPYGTRDPVPLATNGNGEKSEQLAPQWLATLWTHGSPVGQQRDDLARLAGYYARLRQPKDVTAAQLWMLTSRFRQDAAHPWTEAQVRELVSSIYAKDSAAVGQVKQRRLVSVCANTIIPERVDWLWPGRLALGKVTVLDGDPGQAKSAVTVDLAARISTGAMLPDETSDHDPGGVVIVNYEDGMADTIVPRLIAAGADLDRIRIFDVNNAPTIPDDLAAIDAAAEAVGAVLLVIDPLMAGISDGADSHNDHSMRRILRPLAALADRRHLAVLAPRHRPKGGGRNAVTSGNGSIAIIGAARCGLTATLDPEAPEDVHRHLLAVSKSNLAAHAATLKYQTVKTTINDDIETVAVEWLGTSMLTGDAIVACEAKAAERSGRRDIVESVAKELQGILSGGPLPATEVYRRIGRDDVDRVLRQAKQLLGIHPAKASGKGKASGWTWALPAPELEREAS